MNKKYTLWIVGVLVFCLLLPNNLDAALAESYYVKSNGLTNSLHSNYTWYEGSQSGYLTEQEQKSKRNLKCDSGDIQRWYSTCSSRCGIDQSKLTPSLQKSISSCSYNFGGIGKNLNASQSSCLSVANGSNGICTRTDGSSSTFRIATSNIGYTTSCGTTPGETLGVWAKSNPDTKFYSSTNYTKTKCTWGGSNVTSTKNLVQNVYGTSTGAAAYCVNPGKSFVNQNYVKVGPSYDVSGCKKSNDSYECGLAATVYKAEKEFGADYLTTVTALRFWAAAHGQDSDAWWDSQTNTVYQNSGIYKITADYVKSNGYSGDTSSPKLGVIFGDGGSITQLQNAITIYKAVEAGFDIRTPKADVISQEYNKEAGVVDVVVASNFDGSTRIEKITVEPALNGITYTAETCPANKIGDYCLRLTIPISLEQVREGILIKGLIEYSSDADVIAKVGLYKASNNPSKYQYMVIFDRGVPSTVPFEISLKAPVCTFEGGTWYDRDGKVTDYDGYKESCGCIEEDGKYYIHYPEEVTYKEYYEECEKIKCPDKGIDYSDMPEDCEEDGSTGVIKDPEICNILNRDDANYKTEYGNGFCTIYCRETLDFTFMDKETAIAGRFFKHDVTAKYSTIAYLSTVILSSRQCTSLINYDKWKKEYESANDSVLSTWNRLKTWEAVYNGTGGGHPTAIIDTPDAGPNCCGGVGQGIWNWQYQWHGEFNYNYCTVSGNNPKVANCGNTANASKTSTGTTASVWDTCCPGWFNGQPTCSGCCGCRIRNATSGNANYVINGYNAAVTAYTGALNRRDTLLYQLQDCNFMSNEAKSDKSLVKMYPKGTFYVSKARGNYTSRVGLTTYNQIMTSKSGNTVDIDYDENSKYNEGFDISTSNNQFTPNVVTHMGFSNQGEWENYCSGNCDNDLRSLVGSSYTEELDYWLCTGSELNAKCVNTKSDSNHSNDVIVPSNKLVNIIIEQESLHYQENAFYTQVYTGTVSTSGNSVGYWIPLVDDVAGYHLYPVGIKRPTGSYGIQVTFTDLGNQDRVVKFEDGEFKCAYQVINDLAVYDCDDNYHTCYPCTGDNCYPGDNPKNPYDLGVYFRTIDLNDVFPNSVYSPDYNNRPQSLRPIGSNWRTNNSKNIVQQIQELNTGVWQIEPMYEVTLNRQTIAEIKKHNKTTNYLNLSLTCDGLSCTSDFLNETLRDILQDKYNENYKKNTTIKKSELYYYNR